MSIKAILRGGCALAALVCYSWSADACVGTCYIVDPGQTQTVATPVTVGPVTVSGLGASGGGTLIFTNSGNSYAGGTTINLGAALQVTTNTELGNAAGGVTLGDATYNGVLDLSTSTSNITSNRNFTIDAGGGTIVTGTGGTWTLSGAFSGSGPLQVAGTGDLILTGNNSGYAGGIYVTNGSL